MVNPFRCKMLYKKLSLAVLSDERNADMFSEEERTPPSKPTSPGPARVEERNTTYGGLPIDLVPFIHKYQRPTGAEAQRRLRRARHCARLANQRQRLGASGASRRCKPHIVQERVVIPEEPYPSLCQRPLKIYDRMLDTAPFIFYGDYVDGCLTRLSTDPLLNVSAGGGSTVPTFVVEKR
jgi:hypothetical protein